jgi:hypothetical protein
MLKYGAIDDPTERKFQITTETDQNYIHLTMINLTYKESPLIAESTLQGLEMVQEFSKALGRFRKSEKSLENSDYNEFKITLSIKKKGASDEKTHSLGRR